MMDLIASAPRVPKLGETVIGTSFQTAPGGKGANQALQCARLGADVTMVGCVGADAFGQEMCQALKDAGVDVSHVRISEKSSSGVGHIQLEVKETGVQNRILVVPGSNYDLMPEDLEWLKEKIREYDLLMLQLELRMDTITTAARIAHEAGVRDGTLAKATTNLLHSILYFLHCHAVLDIIKQRELLSTVFGREFNGTDGDRSDLRVPRIPLLKTPKCGSGDLRGKLCLER